MPPAHSPVLCVDAWDNKGEHFIDKPIDEVEKHMNEDNIAQIANSRKHTILDGSQGAQVSKDDIIVDGGQPDVTFNIWCV